MSAQFVICVFGRLCCTRHVDLFEQGTEPMGTGDGDDPPIPGKSGVVVGVDPRSPANRAGDGDGPPRRIGGDCRRVPSSCT